MKTTTKARLTRLGLGGAVTVLAVAIATPAAAGPTLIATRPQPEAGSDDFTFFVGGVDESGRSIKASSFELIVDGKRSDTPVLGAGPLRLGDRGGGGEHQLAPAARRRRRLPLGRGCPRRRARRHSHLLSAESPRGPSFTQRSTAGSARAGPV